MAWQTFRRIGSAARAAGWSLVLLAMAWLSATPLFAEGETDQKADTDHKNDRIVMRRLTDNDDVLHVYDNSDEGRVIIINGVVARQYPTYNNSNTNLDFLLSILSASDANTRRNACNRLKRIRNERIVEPVIRLLEDPENNIRCLAAQVLGNQRDSRATAPLVAMLQDKSETAYDTKTAAAAALGELGDPAAGGPLLEALKDPNPYLRRMVAISLGKLKVPEALEPLIAQLEAMDAPPGSDGAAIGLGFLGRPEAVEPLLRAMKRANVQLRRSAVQSLGLLRDARALEPLTTAATEDTDPQTRLLAIGALGNLGDSRAAASLTRLANDTDPPTRLAAATSLCQLGDPAGLDFLAKMLSDEQPNFQYAAAAVIVRIEGPRAIGILMEAATNGSAQICQLVTNLLVLREDVSADEWLKGIAAEGNERWFLRMRSAEALAKLKEPRAIEPTIALLEDNNFQLRLVAADALRQIGDGRAVMPLAKSAAVYGYSEQRDGFLAALIEIGKRGGAMPAFLEALKPPPPPPPPEDPKAGEVLEVFTTCPTAQPLIAQALGEIGDKEAVDPLIARLSDPASSSELCEKAAEALGRLGDARAEPVLLSTLQSKETSVRQAAVSALGALGQATSAAAVVAMLRDSDWTVRDRAVNAAAQIGAATVEPLLALHNDPDPAVRTMVARALGKVADPRTVDPLLPMLEDSDTNVREAAATALGLLKDRRATEPLMVILSKDSDPRLRWMAAEALGRIGDPTALDPLLEALKGDAEWRVRQTAAEAAGRLGDAKGVEPLITALADDHWYVRRTVAASLHQITGQDFGEDATRWQAWLTAKAAPSNPDGGNTPTSTE